MPAVAVLDTGKHDRKRFTCGVEPLDQYLHQRAARDMDRGIAVCHVSEADDDPTKISGFYTLSSLSIELTGLPAVVQKKLPKYPHVPATLIGRLAVSAEHRGQRLGEFLLLDALKHAMESSETIGSAFVVVDAKDGKAAAFYMKYGFAPLPDNPARLYMPMSDVAQLFAPT